MANVFSINEHASTLSDEMLVQIIDETNNSINGAKINIQGDTIKIVSIETIDPITTQIKGLEFKLITIKGVKPHSYYISKYGHVLSVNNNTDKTLFLMKHKTNGRYDTIALSRDPDLPNTNKDQTDNHYYSSIHKLVKFTWDPDDLSYKTMMKPVIKHLDGDNSNNYIGNLVFTEKVGETIFDNLVVNNNVDIDTIKAIARDIRADPDRQMTDIAKAHGVTRGLVADIKYGYSWSKYSGISVGEYMPEEQIPLPKEVVDEIIVKLQEGKTNTEILNEIKYDNLRIGQIVNIRNGTIYRDKTSNLNIPTSSEAYYKHDIVGNKGDTIIFINGVEYKDIVLKDVVPHKYYINRDGVIEDVNWESKKSKTLHMDIHVNGKKTYNQYLLRRNENDWKENFVVCKEDLVLYFWNPPTNYRPKVFDMLEAGNRDQEPRDEYTGEKLKRPSPLTREKAEEIAQYISQNPDVSVSEVGKLFGISRSSVGHLKSGDTFKDICEKYHLRDLVKKNTYAYLTEEKVIEIADYIVANPNETNISIAERFNVHKDTISHIKCKSNFAKLLKDYDFNITPRESFTHLERCMICKMHFVDHMIPADIARSFGKEPHIVSNFLRSKFAEWWQQTYFLTVTIPQFEALYFTNPLSMMNGGKGVTPFDCDQSQQYAPITSSGVTGKGLTPFELI